MRIVIQIVSLIVLPWTLLGCAKRDGEDLSLSTEAQLLRAYIQAADCIVLRASGEEKRRLTAGMPYVDKDATGESDLRDIVERRIEAENFLYELLPQRCPDTSRSIVFWSDLIEDRRALSIYESHFSDLVGMAVAVNGSSPEDLRRLFESEHTPIGDTTPRY